VCVYNLYIVCQNGYWLYLSYRKGSLAKFFIDLVAYKVTVESNCGEFWLFWSREMFVILLKLYKVRLQISKPNILLLLWPWIWLRN
jgi:hypothetical protein